MTKCLATFGVGEAELWREYTLPRMKCYAKKHGYAFSDGCVRDHRPPSWWKVPLIAQLLHTHDEVLWLDADVMIRRFDKDIAGAVHQKAWHGMVLHHVHGPSWVPNCGVWFLRKEMIPVLESMDTMSQYDNHCNWEQAALISYMGGDPDLMSKKPLKSWPSVSKIEQNTEWLPYEWNLHPHDVRKMPRSGRFWHATQFPDRLSTLKLWSEE